MHHNAWGLNVDRSYDEKLKVKVVRSHHELEEKKLKNAIQINNIIMLGKEWREIICSS